MKQPPKNLKKYIPIVVATVIFIIIIAIVDLTLSKYDKEPEIKPTTTTYPSLSPTYLKNLPTRYKDTPIPQSVYDQGFGKYRNANNQKVREYVLNRVERYYIYKEIIKSNNLDYRRNEEFGFDGMEKEVPEMEKAIKSQLIGSIDFAYVKVKYKNMVSSPEAISRYGDLKKQASQLIEKYRSLFTSDMDPEEVVARANSDQSLLVLNDNQLNEYKKNYTAEQKLFYTETGFHTFLYKQVQGKVSPSYELKDANGQPYATIIVFVTKKFNGGYTTLDELINTNRINFH